MGVLQHRIVRLVSAAFAVIGWGAVLFVPTGASAAIIDFTGCGAAPGSDASPWIEDGFKITGTGITGTLACVGAGPPATRPVLGGGSLSGLLTLETIDGSPFMLSSFEAASTKAGAPFPQAFIVTANLNGGGTTIHNLVAQSVFDAAVNPTGANGVFSPTGSSILDSVVFNMNNLTYIDNLNVTPQQSRAIPEPGMLALLGFGLAGLGFMRRRYNA